jgi:hypothetical protein
MRAVVSRTRGSRLDGRVSTVPPDAMKVQLSYPGTTVLAQGYDGLSRIPFAGGQPSVLLKSGGYADWSR